MPLRVPFQYNAGKLTPFSLTQYMEDCNHLNIRILQLWLSVHNVQSNDLNSMVFAELI